jgi:hypothetical protein
MSRRFVPGATRASRPQSGTFTIADTVAIGVNSVFARGGRLVTDAVAVEVYAVDTFWRRVVAHAVVVEVFTVNTSAVGIEFAARVTGGVRRVASRIVGARGREDDSGEWDQASRESVHRAALVLQNVAIQTERDSGSASQHADSSASVSESARVAVVGGDALRNIALGCTKTGIGYSVAGSRRAPLRVPTLQRELT